MCVGKYARTHLSQRTGYASRPSQAPRRRPYTEKPDRQTSFLVFLEQSRKAAVLTADHLPLRVHDHPVSACIAAPACAMPRLCRSICLRGASPMSQHLLVRRLAYVAASAYATPGLCRGVCLRDAPLMSQRLPTRRLAYIAASACATPRLCRGTCATPRVHRHSSVLST